MIEYNNLYYKDENYSICIGIDLEDCKKAVLHPNTRIISSCAFKSTKLEGIVFNDKLQRIESAAFERTKVENIILPPQLEKLSQSAFKNCIHLKSIDFSKTDIRKINEKTFQGCKRLEKIILPENLKKICTAAFSGCLNLEEINLPNTVESIGTFGFANTRLKSFVFPENVSAANASVLANCNFLEKIDLKNVNRIEGYAFEGCIELKEIKLPERVFYLAFSAFKNTKVEELILPKDLRTIFITDDESTSVRKLLYRSELDEDLKRRITNGIKEHCSSIQLEGYDLSSIIERCSSFKEINKKYKEEEFLK